MENELFPSDDASPFHQMGNPTFWSSEELRELQKDYVNRNDPNTFYITIDPRSGNKIVWSYNTAAHIKAKVFTYKSFFSAIHPFWSPMYVGILDLNRRLFEPNKTGKNNRDFILTSNVPLRHKSGKYYWYSQISIAGTFDARGGMVEYLCEFHQLAEFDRMMPSLQSLTYQGVLAEGFDALIKKKACGLLHTALRDLLSPASFKLLSAYWLLKSQSKNISREAVAKHTGLSLQALDKGNLRLLSQAQLAFPAVTLTSVTNFACFLNDFAGPPLPYGKTK